MGISGSSRLLYADSLQCSREPSIMDISVVGEWICSFLDRILVKSRGLWTSYEEHEDSTATVPYSECVDSSNRSILSVFKDFFNKKLCFIGGTEGTWILKHFYLYVSKLEDCQGTVFRNVPKWTLKWWKLLWKRVTPVSRKTIYCGLGC